MNKIIFLTTFLLFTVTEHSIINAMDSTNSNGIDLLSFSKISINDTGKSRFTKLFDEIKKEEEIKSQDDNNTNVGILTNNIQMNNNINNKYITNSYFNTNNTINNNIYYNKNNINSTTISNTSQNNIYNINNNYKNILSSNTANQNNINTHKIPYNKDYYNKYLALTLKNANGDNISYSKILGSINDTKSIKKTTEHFALDYNTVYNVWLDGIVVNKKNRFVSIREFVDYIKQNGLKNAYKYYKIKSIVGFPIYLKLDIQNTQGDHISYAEIFDSFNETHSIDESAKILHLDTEIVYKIYYELPINN